MMNKSMIERRDGCLECGSPVYGRTDKKFCCKECKNKYHNQENREFNKLRSDVFSGIMRNHDILHSLLKQGQTSAKLVDLEEEGFNVKLITSHRKGRCKRDEYACLDLWYYRNSSRIYNLHKKEVKKP